MNALSAIFMTFWSLIWTRPSVVSKLRFKPVGHKAQMHRLRPQDAPAQRSTLQ